MFRFVSSFLFLTISLFGKRPLSDEATRLPRLKRHNAPTKSEKDLFICQTILSSAVHLCACKQKWTASLQLAFQLLHMRSLSMKSWWKIVSFRYFACFVSGTTQCFRSLIWKGCHLKLWNKVNFVAFEPFIVVIMKGSVSWCMMCCSLVKVNTSFGIKYRFHSQGRRAKRKK